MYLYIDTLFLPLLLVLITLTLNLWCSWLRWCLSCKHKQITTESFSPSLLSYIYKKHKKTTGVYLFEVKSLLVGWFSFWSWELFRPERWARRTGCLLCCWGDIFPRFWAAALSGTVWTACSTMGALLPGTPWSPGTERKRTGRVVAWLAADAYKKQ